MHFLTGIPGKYWHSPSWCCNTVTSITRCNIRTVKHDRGRKDDLKKKLMQNALFSFSPRRCICGIIAFMHTHSIWSMNLVHTLVLLSKKKNEKRRWENACLVLVLGGMNQTLTAVPHSLTHIHTFTHRHSTWKALGIISDSDGSSNSQSEVLLSKTQPKNIETESIRALVRSPSMRFPPRLPVSLPLIELFSYWYIYIYIWSIYILYSTYWLWWLYDIHVIYTFLSGQPKQNGRSNNQRDPLTHLISSSNQATCTHSL